MSEAPAIDYFDDVPQAPAEVQEQTLERLTKLAQEAKDLQTDISRREVELAEEQAKLERIMRGHIPEIMAALGLEEFKLLDGSKVTVKESVNASISEERKPEAFAWLREHEFDGIIKTNVSLAFGKGEQEAVKKAMDSLKAAGFAPNIAENVHPQTLKSFVKERLAEGDNIPLDTFGVFEFKEAKIALPKTRTRK